MASDDNRHTRTDDCRFPYHESASWVCPSCIKHHHSKHSGHTLVLTECRWAAAPTRSSGSRARQPHVRASRVDEAHEDFDETAGQAPPITALGVWKPFNELLTISYLEEICRTDGWHNTEDGPASVQSNSRNIRTCEPRFSAENYDTYTVYGMFPDHEHPAGQWWLLFSYKPMEPKVLEYSVPVLVIVYHKIIKRQTSSTKIKPDNPARPFQDLIGTWEEQEEKQQLELDEALDAAPITPKRRPYVPVEAVDEEEILPDVLDLAVQPPVGELAVAGQEAEIVPVNPVDWSSWDLGRNLRSLRSGNVSVATRALRQLHLRWWHASKQKMTALLRAAGLPVEILNLIQGVCDTCRICRMWSKPGERPQASLRLSTDFNVAIQVDLVFVDSLIVLHIIDECIRWSAGYLLASKEPSSILDGLVTSWFRMFGSPKVIISDHEGSHA